jgi:hypothetical protein
MRGTPDRVDSGDVAIEDRDPRFAELDAQIKNAVDARAPSLSPRWEQGTVLANVSETATGPFGGEIVNLHSFN